MNYLLAIIFGIIQGLTEFLPVSSSGHLVIFHDIFKLDLGDNLAFDVFLHWGTLLALLVFFYKDIIRYLKAFINSLRKMNIRGDLDQKIAWLIILTMIPAGIVGLFFEDILDVLFRNLFSVALALIIVGIIFLIVEKYSLKRLDLASLTWQKALLLGLAQALALIPGVSRSGATISTGLILNLNRETAARFSFLMSIPIVFAAGCKKMLDLFQDTLAFEQILVYILGFISAALVGYLAIGFLLKYLKNNSLAVFAYYRIALGLIILLILFLS